MVVVTVGVALSVEMAVASAVVLASLADGMPEAHVHA